MKELMFEGSEKKLEIILSPTTQPLRNKSTSFWESVCGKANANIVSRFSNSFCDSYILSESSLFIWDHSLLMLTCGQTSLVNALFYLLKKIKKSDIELLFYQRKNENFPHVQKTYFMQDLPKINKKIEGQAYCFGAPDNHHFYLFHSKSANHIPKYRTIEILIYDIEDYIKDFFLKATSASDINKQLGLDKIFLGAQIEDYLFKPVGYSLNGLIKEDQYYTIHVTPQEPGFYISFETNVQEGSVTDIVEKVLSIFKPNSFDVIVFSPFTTDTKNSEYRQHYFIRSAYVTKRLECGYKVSFSSFFTPFINSRQAVKLTTKNES